MDGRGAKEGIEEVGDGWVSLLRIGKGKGGGMEDKERIEKEERKEKEGKRRKKI